MSEIHQHSFITTYDKLTYYQRFEIIKRLVDSMMADSTDVRIGSCCSDIRITCNRYFRDVAPKRGD